MQNPTKQFR